MLEEIEGFLGLALTSGIIYVAWLRIDKVQRSLDELTKSVNALHQRLDRN